MKLSSRIVLIIQALLSLFWGPSLFQRHLLKYTITKLMEIARQPLPEQPDAKQDLPQSHALNILRVLFVNSGLAWDVLPYAEEAVQLAIDGFASSNWSVQNSSMQLLGMYACENNYENHIWLPVAIIPKSLLACKINARW